MNEPTYVKNTILLKGDLIQKYTEARVGAGVTVTPGMLVEKDADTTYDSTHFNAAFRPHSVVNGNAEAIVAMEPMYPGTPDGGAGDTGGIDDVYAAGELMHLHQCQPGDELYMFLKTGNNALLTSYLSSAGDGTLQVSTTVPLFKPLEALNNTSGAKARIKVRKL